MQQRNKEARSGGVKMLSCVGMKSAQNTEQGVERGPGNTFGTQWWVVGWVCERNKQGDEEKGWGKGRQSFPGLLELSSPCATG
jgi:hypothetical protein